MHDLREAVVVLRGLNEQLIEVARRRWWVGITRIRLKQNRKQNRREQRARLTGFKCRNARSIFLDESVISLLLREKGAVCREIDKQPAAMFKQCGIEREAGRVNHGELAREQWLPHGVSEHFAPADHVGVALESRHLTSAPARAATSVVCDRG